MAYITHLMVLKGNDQPPPENYHKINVDLNQGAGGEYLYFAYARGSPPEAAITDIKILYGDRSTDFYIEGYTMIGVDLNAGAKGKYIYTFYSHDSTLGKPIKDLQVITGDSPEILPPSDEYSKIDVDLNMAAGGSYLYLCYSRQ